MAEENTVLSAPEPPADVLTSATTVLRRPWTRRLARRLVLDRLRGIEAGSLMVLEDGTRHVFGRGDGDPPLAARLTIEDPACWDSLAWGGSIGAAEAYCDGLWSTPDLIAVVRVLARNQDTRQRVDAGTAALLKPLRRMLHRMRRNTWRGSRRNISAHYDTGNTFFATFLDPTMTYSCAVFDREEISLETAQRAKLDLVCRKLRLGPRDRLVEIGAGWGSLAVHAARNHGCRVVTTTISEEQFDHTSLAVARAGLSDRVTVLHEDYRALTPRFRGAFDKLAAIEMVEAVGHDYLPDYLRTVSDLLAPDGLALLQAILMPDHWYEEYRRSVDFIQRHIFPGGLLPSLARLQACAAEASDLRLVDLEDLTADYARTLAEWRTRFEAQDETLAALGLSAWERRKWRYYFAYCEGGFLERTISATQILYAKPGFRGAVPARRWPGTPAPAGGQLEMTR
ncbi:MAG: class I SAM-dependent methyltransferase [Acidobacteria bacterium]|nr:class I SAM-dependent methyltransferase [Acidobacteriota bacterium]